MTTYTLLSEDEAINLRKDSANSSGVLAKGVPVVADVIKAGRYDADAREARFVMSAEVPDRMGDVVVQEGLDTTNFEANPQGLLFHNSRSWPIGSWKDLEKNLTGRPKRTMGTLKLLPEGEDPDADRAARHLKHGTMRTVSIGFRPDYKAAEIIRDDDNRYVGVRWNKGELLECSLVPIPALPAAAMKELTTGMLSPESLELIKGIVEEFALDTAGAVVRRDELAAVVREVEGTRTHHEVKLPAALQRAAAETDAAYIERLLIEVAKKGGEDGGEGVPVQTDPADGEKQKNVAEQIESSAEFIRMRDLVKEHARRSSEPGLFASLLSKFTGAPAAPAQPNPPPVETKEEPAPVLASAEAKAALKERMERSISSAAKVAAEPNPA